jgi:hypothetical protein
MAVTTLRKGAPTLTHHHRTRDYPPVFKIKKRAPGARPAKHHFVRDGNDTIIDCPRCRSISVSIMSDDISSEFGVPSSDTGSGLRAVCGDAPVSHESRITNHESYLHLAALRCRSCAHEWVSEVSRGD